MLIDSHCHLNFPDFKDDLDQVLNRAQDLEVNYFLTINTRLQEIYELQALTEQYRKIFCSVGIHPHHAEEYDHKNLCEEIFFHTQHPKTIGIGETGLDYYYDNSPKLQQINVFEQHLQAAEKSQLPVIVHTRAADDDTINTLRQYPKVYGVLHCFSGTQKLAEKALDIGFYLSCSGIITFKKTEVLQEIIKNTPLNRILVETDSPYLAPIPHRGKRNEPAYTRLNAEKVAEIKGISLEEVSIATTNNFFKLFSKAKQFTS